MSTGSSTVLFWGAGATASLGIHTTENQGRFLRALAPRPDRTEKLKARVRTAFERRISNRWVAAFCDLLKILGDREMAKEDTLSAADIHEEQLKAMSRNWERKDDEELRKRIVELRSLYDWPALVAAINVCPGGASKHDTGGGATGAEARFELIDLFNLLDMHHQSGHGFPNRQDTFLPPQRVIGARGALVLLIQALTYVDWHAHARGHLHLQQHQDFALELGRRMQREGLRFAAAAGPDDFELDDFIEGEVSVVSMNWDPIGLWAQFVANRSLNRDCSVPHVGSPACRMQLYHELGYFVAGPRIDKKHVGSKIWQPMNISSARQLNDHSHGANLRIRVSKYLFPHGCLWWRECPNCGKLSSYIGDEWAVDSASLLPPPPLKAFVQHRQFKSWLEDDGEYDKWRLGEVDARACVHCKTLTYAHHTPVVMQTSFKTAPPPFLEEIQREMRVVVQEANHVVLMGYSLPPDDVTYRAFLAARIRKTSGLRTDSEPQVRCSVVGKQNGYDSRWLYLEELDSRGKLPDAVNHARDVFGAENVRYFGAGIPDVFLNGGTNVSPLAVERLLAWERCYSRSSRHIAARTSQFSGDSANDRR